MSSQDMTRVFKILAVIVLSVGLFGCREDIPLVVSGSVFDSGLFMGEFIMKRDGHDNTNWDLTKTQIEQLNFWLQNHRDGWQMILASPPPPSFSIVVTHSDGARSRLDLFDMNDKWKHVIVVHATSPSNNGIRKLSTAERDELLALLKKNS